jgi:hypothetical protein
MVASAVIDARPAALIPAYSNVSNVSAEIVAVGLPLDVAVLSVDHHRSHNNNQHQ